MHKDEPEDEPENTTRASTLAHHDLAIELLHLQERINAWDRTCDEELGGLRRELEALRVEYLRRCLAQHQATKGGPPGKVV